MSRMEVSSDPAEPCEFKPGDVVRLNTWGPMMVVSMVTPYNGRWLVWCRWFDLLGVLHSYTFGTPELRRVQSGG